MKAHYTLIACILALTTVTSCKKATTAATAASSNNAAAAVIAVSSPTATSSTSLVLRQKEKGFWLYAFDKILSPLGLRTVNAAEGVTIEPTEEMLADLSRDLATATPAALAADIGTFAVTSANATCYGPGWLDDAVTPGGATTNRPTGDLGMVSTTSSPTDTTTACAAAQLNALVGGLPNLVNRLVRLQGTMIAVIRDTALDLPGVGGSTDVLSSMPTISGLTLNTATISRLADDSEARAVYKTSSTFTDSNSKTGSLTIYHTPKNTANTNFTGLFQAVVAAGSYKRGVSMVYDQTDGVFTYGLDTAESTSATSTDFFLTTGTKKGRIDYSATTFQSNGHRIIASYNTTTNKTTMHYAWQAGRADSSVRSFIIEIPAGTEGALTGYAYFGFGADIAATTDDVSTPWMTKIHCNWLTGFAGGASLAKFQSQTFAQNTAGVFAVSTSNITFAPTNTCDTSQAWTVTDFNNMTPNAYEGARTATTNNLVAMGANGTVSAVTVPTFTQPD